MTTRSRLLVALAALLLGLLYVLPIWRITLEAPQYPEGIGMLIWVDTVTGASDHDLNSINKLNHYIGMKTIPKPEEMWEFEVFPLVIIAMVALGVLIGILGFIGKVSYKWFLGWFILMSVLGVLGMYDFNAWLTDYGSNLDPNAIMKLTHPDGTPMTYSPPLLGHEKMLNFDVTSLPHTGAWMMFVGMSLTVVAFFLGWRKRGKKA